MLFLARILEMEGILVIHLISKLRYFEPQGVLGILKFHLKICSQFSII